jgi:hypothetical protein
MAIVSNDCSELEADLSALLDGELGPERAALLRAHVDACERCRGQFARLARLAALLAGAPLPVVPASLHARLAARIAAANETDTRVRGFAPPRVRAPRRTGWSRAAGALAAIAAGVALYLAVVGREPAPLGGESSPVQIARPHEALSPTAAQLAQRAAPGPGAPSAPAAPHREHAASPPVAPEVVARRPEPAPPAPASLDLDSLPDEDLGIALELDTVEDFDVIANLDLLELMLAKESS